MPQTSISVAAIFLLLLDTSRSDLSSIDGALGVSKGEWAVACFISAVLVALVSLLIAAYKEHKKEEKPPSV